MHLPRLATPLVTVTPQTITRRTAVRDAPARLLSPIRLSERRARPSCTVSILCHSLPSRGLTSSLFKSTASPPCSNVTKRRRTAHSAHTRSSYRSVQCKHNDCPFVRSGPAALERLPWISMMDQPPATNQQNPWDIADLSLLAVDEAPSATPGTGPIRSRKSSLRSAPFPTEPVASTPELLSSLSIDSPLSKLPYSRSRRSSLGDDVLKTPPPRVSELPVAVVFRDLMPISSADADETEAWWQKELPPL